MSTNQTRSGNNNAVAAGVVSTFVVTMTIFYSAGSDLTVLQSVLIGIAVGLVSGCVTLVAIKMLNRRNPTRS